MKAVNSGGPPPLVTVIVTTYNRAKLLSETISSILNQSFADFELIVVDNMSEDATEGYVMGLNDRRIRFFKNPNSGIIAVNRNFGIKRARGKYIAFCDDDDLWFPDKLKTQVEFMESNPGVGLTFSNAEVFGDGGSMTPSVSPPPSPALACPRMFLSGGTRGQARGAGGAAGKAIYAKGESESVKGFNSLLRGNKIATFTVMAAKKCLDDVGFFDESPELKSIEDYDLWLRVARKYALACMPQMLGRYRVHSARTSGDDVFEKKKLLRLVEKFKKSGLVDRREARMMESHVHWMIGNSVLLGGASGGAAFRAHYRRALSLSLNVRTLLGFMLTLVPAVVAASIFRFMGRARV